MQIVRLWLFMAYKFTLGVAVGIDYVQRGGYVVMLASIALLVLAANDLMVIVRDGDNVNEKM